MSYDAILELMNEKAVFEKLISHIGNACFDPSEFG